MSVELQPIPSGAAEAPAVVVNEAENEPDVPEDVNKVEQEPKWSSNQAFRKWSANPLNPKPRSRAGSNSVPPIRHSDTASGFGEILDIGDIHAAQHNISKDVPGFGELIDPNLIGDVTTVAKKSPAAAPTQEPSSPPAKGNESLQLSDFLSPRIDMKDLLVASKDLEGVDDKEAAAIFDDDIAAVGDLDASGLEDVDDAEAEGIVNPPAPAEEKK